MFDVLDRQTRLTGNQKKIITAAVIGDALEFFDYFLIGFVLAFLIGPWKLTFGQSAIVLLSSGVGAILGAYIWGWLADRIGRRKVFIGTVLNFSIATGLLYVDPQPRDLHAALDTVQRPLNALQDAELCPGRAALEKINASLR